MECWYCKNKISKIDRIGGKYWNDGKIWCPSCLNKIGQSPEGNRKIMKDYNEGLQEFVSKLNGIAKDWGLK